MKKIILIFFIIIIFIQNFNCIKIPYPFYKKFEEKNIIQNSNDYPVWPGSFNCTLLKLIYINNTISWTKLYYDANNKRSRFDFFSHYVDKNGNWGETKDIILFVNTTVWFINPKERKCTIRSNNLPTISRHWLRGTSFNRNLLFKEQYSEEWEFKDGPNKGLKYFARSSKNNDMRYPLRSTNQVEDPGDTDYSDFVVGEQNSNLFIIPNYCQRL
jgi:hypothetical protein